MRRILVPLDGTELAEAILPDAIRLAGPGGELVLIRDVTGPMYDSGYGEYSQRYATDVAEEYLNAKAESIRAKGLSVRTETIVLRNIAEAIDRAADEFKADMIACATHGRHRTGLLTWGSIAWKVLANSPVPVLLRHVEHGKAAPSEPKGPRQIMVPLDGSGFAEAALPLARSLALEWQAPIWLVQAVPDPLQPPALDPYGMITFTQEELEKMRKETEDYLKKVASTLPGEVRTSVMVGPTVDCLVDAVGKLAITDVVMASHGRTGLSRVILGSVADALIQQLYCPIIVIPALAVQRRGDLSQGNKDHEPAGEL
jgi:nucleotide-binding universal stress UspA family protein